MSETIYKEENATFLHRLAKALSGIFSPILIPTYAYAIALWITPLSASSERVRLISSLVVFAITAAVPLFTIIFLMRAGIVSDPSIPNRKERTIPFIVSILCYIAAGIYVSMLNAPQWLVRFFFAAAAIALIAWLINNFWKISAHASSMGGLCAMMFFISVKDLAVVQMMPWLTVILVLCGAVCSSRLVLNRHTQWQVYAGFVLGFVVAYLIV